jgi:3-oxoacyl-[acyl-carrier-protein] synthase II
MERVVITGLGAITPIGNYVKEFWQNLIEGKSGIGPITKFDASNFKTRIAAEVKNFDPLQYLEKSESRKMDLFSQFAMAVMDECIKDSAVELEKTDLNRVGVIWGSGIGGIQTFEDEILSFGKNPLMPRFSPFFITKMISNMAAGFITIKYGLHGVSYATTSACASGNNAIIDAFNLIRLGRANAIFAGGSEACITHSALGGFSSMKAISERNDSPETASRPFDQSRDGFVLGEGGGVLLLEELGHALRRGANIYCEITGAGFSSDAYHVAAPHPEGLGAVLAMHDALNDAQLVPADVDFISAHGTATPAGDISECNAIANVFGDSLDSLHVSANKSMIGHLLGAAGAVEAVACVLAIKNNLIPPTINLNDTDPAIDSRMNLCPLKAVKKNVNVVLNNTFGFGGHIFVSLFQRYKS